MNTLEKIMNSDIRFSVVACSSLVGKDTFIVALKIDVKERLDKQLRKLFEPAEKIPYLMTIPITDREYRQVVGNPEDFTKLQFPNSTVYEPKCYPSFRSYYRYFEGVFRQEEVQKKAAARAYQASCGILGGKRTKTSNT